jgi:hypothetical protein
MGDLVKALKPVTEFAKSVDPIFTLALSAMSVYGTYKALQGVKKGDMIAEEKASWDRQYEWSEQARNQAERENRTRRVYDHLGFSPPTKYAALTPGHAAEVIGTDAPV